MTSLCLQGTSRSCLLEAVVVVDTWVGMVGFYVGDDGFVGIVVGDVGSDDMCFDGDVAVGMVLGDVGIVA